MVEIEIFKDGKFLLEVKIADSIFSKIKGLMFKSINKKEGLLMCFDKEDERSVWMPFIKQPLCILFLDKNKRIIDKTKAVPITFNPKTWKIYRSNEKCKYILETHINRVRDFETGDRLEWGD